jgi:hypothetical protein
MDAAFAMRLTVALAGTGVVMSSLEYLTCPKLLADDALASWQVSRTNRPWKVSRGFDVMLGWLFEYPRFIIVVAVRLIAAVLMVIGWPPSVFTTASIIAVASALLALRSGYGTDGADQMSMIIFVAAALASAVHTTLATVMFLWFITSQACLAYFIAGFAKLMSPVWRDGRALPGIFGTTSYGYRELGPLLARHHHISRLCGWSVIILECSFPGVLLGIRPLTLTLLACGLGFHIAGVFVMRLNTFLWAFMATYPSILFCTLR